ncbi:MAG TPA: metal-dependent hydrolase [Burkholderiales bacterium]
MDTLTHALSGALLARATEPRTRRSALPRRTRMAVGFWAAAFPDSDFVLRFADPLTYLTTHRGVTHSLLMLPLWAIGLAFAFHLLYRRRYPWRAFVGVCALSLGVHIVGDVITSFGTMVLAPLSDWRAALPVTFIIDPFFTGIIVAGLVASHLARDSRRAAAAASLVLAAYVGFQGVLHAHAVRIGEAYAQAQRLERATAHALPQPFSPFHWMVVVEQPEAYHLSYVSLIRGEVRETPPDAGFLRRVYDSYRPVDEAIWQRVPRYGDAAEDAALAQAFWASDAFARYRRFAMFPSAYRVSRTAEHACVWFADLRFALVGRSMPFRYVGCRAHEAAAWVVRPVDEPGDPGLFRSFD